MADVLQGANALLIDQMALTSQESVVVTADTDTDPQVIEALVIAARLAGARICVLTIPTLPFQGALADPYVPRSVGAAVTDCDVWIDLTLPYLAGSHVFDTAIATKAVRYNLAVGMTSRALANLYGRVDLDALYQIQSSLEALANAAQANGDLCRIKTVAGTDITFKLGRQMYVKPRRATTGGAYSVPGNLFLEPDIDSVKGNIVLECVFHEYYTKLEDPISLVVDGSIRSVEGGGTHNRLMARALTRACGGNLGYVIHLTHAFNPAARFDAANLLEDVRAAGCDAVGLGRPWWHPGGGENHPDGVMSRQSLWIGSRQIAEEGRFVGEFAHFEDALVPKII